MTLEERILDALERGDHAAVKKLQNEYRSLAVVCASDRGSAIAGGAQIAPRPRKARAPAPSASEKKRSLWSLQRGRTERQAAAPPPVELRESAQPRVEVVVEPHARRVMADEVWLHLSELRNGYEVGGYLLGSIEQGLVKIAAASGPGERGVLGRGACWLDDDAGFSLERELRDEHGRSDELLGIWHSHPSGNAEPSQADLVTCVGKLAGLRTIGRELPFFLLLVAPASEDGEPAWRPAESARAWVVRLEERACEPAHIRNQKE
jgi:proteasome lid subunit RPN8/RPN11